MLLPYDNTVSNAAWQVIRQSATAYGIKASTEQTDNYNRIWARDSAVAALAVLFNQHTAAYPNVLASLTTMIKAASPTGQVPSNVTIDENGDITGVSFGGPVGRTDAGFWTLIAAVMYLQQQPDESFAGTIRQQCHKIFTLATHWEFNYKGLMYLPMSSNWADEYITHGYVLYDQLLRYWALDLAGHYFNEISWIEKSLEVKTLIKQHYLLEAELEGSVYTQHQQQQLQGRSLADVFIASFTPGDRVERYDAWSMALLLLLDIPSHKSTVELVQVLETTFTENGNNGIPAFFPVINTDDALYQQLRNNHNYRFKNAPGHFHNGGIWPVVNGFLVAGLVKAGYTDTATAFLHSIHRLLETHLSQHPFAEYFDAAGHPFGVKNLCYSAAGYLIALGSLHRFDALNTMVQPASKNNVDALSVKTGRLVKQVLDNISFNLHRPTAISVAGESGSGKTTFSIALYNELTRQGKQVLLLHQDDYFVLPPQQNHQARLQNFNHIGTGEVRLDTLDEHIHIIKSKSQDSIVVPYMNWETDTEERVVTPISHVEVVVVDGTYTSLLQQVDYRIFINTNYKHTRKNRISRNRETVTDFIERVLEKESAIIQSHSGYADLVVDKDFEIISPL